MSVISQQFSSYFQATEVEHQSLLWSCLKPCSCQIFLAPKYSGGLSAASLDPTFSFLQDTELQRKLDHEIRMRDGACKLLAACSQREQALEATKSLLVCNSRILNYMGELQRRKEAQVLGKRGRR